MHCVDGMMLVFLGFAVDAPGIIPISDVTGTEPIIMMCNAYMHV